MALADPLRPADRPWRAAAGWMLFLGPFFFLIYGFCNWLTARRSGVGTFYFEWERAIPFLPLMIVPYMSIDLFFAGSPFLCRTREEIRTLARRIVFAILVSAAGFLLFPLQFGFPRPAVSGLSGSLFALLTSFDQPYNQAPSLHISLRSIIWSVYWRYTAGPLRAVLSVWFLLIGVSVLFTYQHHVVDVVSGQLVSLLAFYWFPGKRPEAARSTPNRKLAVAYGAAAALLWATAWGLRPIGLFLGWPALALTLLAAAYLRGSTALFGKSQGRLARSASAVLAPYLAGAWISFNHYRRLDRPYDRVAVGVILGRRLNERESEEAARAGVTAVLDLTAEYPESRRFRSLPYRNVQILDLTVPSLEQLDEAVDFVRAEAGRGTVYVHCALGYSRSACVVAAYLLAEGQAGTVEEAVARVQAARPKVVMSPNVMAALRQYQRRRAIIA